MRGLSREKQHWGDVLPQLQALFAPEPCEAIDFTGAGDRYYVKPPLSVAAIADECLENVLSFEPPYRFIGLSMGAMVTLAMSQKIDIDRMVLINTSLRNLSPFYERLHWSVIPVVIQCLFTQDRLKRERAILQLTSGIADQKWGIIPTWCQIQALHPVSLANALRQLYAASRFEFRGNSGARTLVISSRNDQLVDSQCSRALAQLLQADVRMHPWAGHDLPLDDPAWLIDTIMEWFTPSVATST